MATGMMLARKGWQVTVLDKRSNASAFETEKGSRPCSSSPPSSQHTHGLCCIMIMLLHAAFPHQLHFELKRRAEERATKVNPKKNCLSIVVNVSLS